MKQAASIDRDEIARFSGHAQEWWNPAGALRPLHKLNPVRMEYIRDTICAHFGRKAGGGAFKGLSILDIGCGGGLLCEPMARLGADVTGLDASREAVAAAKAHAAQAELKIDYVCSSVEAFADGLLTANPSPLKTKTYFAKKQNKSKFLSPLPLGERKFDVITALEILEHVADIDSLLASASRLLKPNGIMILSTLNRTPKSFLLGIVAAEYILQWVPRGTHDWRKFIRPSELAAHLEKAGMQVSDITGMIYDPLNDDFHLKQGDVGVNYLMSAVR